MNFDFSKFNSLAAGATTANNTQVSNTENVEEVKETFTAGIKKFNTNTPATAPPSKAVYEMEQSYYELSENELKAKVKDTVNNLKNIEKELNDIFKERKEEINMLLLAIISSTNAFLHGPAGTGKSELAELLSRRIESSNYFRVLMGKTTEPAEVFGPVSLNAMKRDSYKVNTENKLPLAHIGFLDEIFKANSAILNSLLTIMNEKLFFNEVVEQVPLISIIGASNEYPEEDSLAALYDRFLLRWHVNYIQDAGERMDMFNGFLNSRKRKNKLSTQSLVAATSTAETTVDIQDIMMLNEVCKDVEIPLKVLKSYNSLLIKLEKKGISVSDRRKNEALKVIQASAILNNRDSAIVEDFEALKYILWSNQKDIPVIVEEINIVANPNQVKYDGYVRTMVTFRNDLEKIEEAKNNNPNYSLDKSVKITEINKTLQFSINNVDKMLCSMDTASKDYEKFAKLRDEIENFLKEIKSQIL